MINVSGPVIIKDNKVLLIKDKKDFFWKFPGGQAEPNETLEQTCIREVKEELGIDVSDLKHLLTITLQKDRNIKVKLIHYLANYSGNIKLGNDIDEWAWLDLDNLPTDCAPNIKQVVDEYKKLN